MSFSTFFTRRLSLYLALALLTQCSKCKHDPTPQPPPTDPLAALPPETQTGAGTFGYLVNGKPFKAPFATSARGDWQSAIRFAIGSDTNLSGQPTAEELTTHIIMEGQLQSNQTFTLIPSAKPHTIFSSGHNEFTGDAAGDMQCYYSGNFIKMGKVELVKFDGVARIASGRFAFTLYEPGGCDTLRVTNGRFDVKF